MPSHVQRCRAAGRVRPIVAVLRRRCGTRIGTVGSACRLRRWFRCSCPGPDLTKEVSMSDAETLSDTETLLLMAAAVQCLGPATDLTRANTFRISEPSSPLAGPEPRRDSSRVDEFGGRRTMRAAGRLFSQRRRLQRPHSDDAPFDPRPRAGRPSRPPGRRCSRVTAIGAFPATLPGPPACRSSTHAG